MLVLFTIYCVYSYCKGSVRTPRGIGWLFWDCVWAMWICGFMKKNTINGWKRTRMNRTTKSYSHSIHVEARSVAHDEIKRSKRLVSVYRSNYIHTLIRLCWDSAQVNVKQRISVTKNKKISRGLPVYTTQDPYCYSMMLWWWWCSGVQLNVVAKMNCK